MEKKWSSALFFSEESMAQRQAAHAAAEATAAALLSSYMPHVPAAYSCYMPHHFLHGVTGVTAAEAAVITSVGGHEANGALAAPSELAPVKPPPPISTNLLGEASWEQGSSSPQGAQLLQVTLHTVTYRYIP